MKLFVARDYWLGSNFHRASEGSTKNLDFLGLKAGDLEALEAQKLGQKESPKILAPYNLKTWEFETTPVEAALLSCWPNEHCRLGIAAKASTFSTFSPLPNYPLSQDHLPIFTNALTNDRLELRFPLPNYPLSRDHLFFFFKCKRQLRTKIPSPQLSFIPRSPFFFKCKRPLRTKIPAPQLSFSQANPFPTFFQIKMTK